MNRFLLSASLSLPLLLPLAASAQNDRGDVIFQQSEARKSDPELRVFITPMVADLEMIYPGKGREEYEAFYNIKSLETLTQPELDDLKNRTLYEFAAEHNADVIVEPIYNCKVSEKNSKRIYISITGYPARYVNFRPVGKDKAELEMLQIVYPAALSGQSARRER